MPVTSIFSVTHNWLSDFKTGVKNILAHIDEWRDAPVWDKRAIAEATKEWFKYLGKDAGSRDNNQIRQE